VAGVEVKLQLDDREARELFARLKASGARNRGLMAEIGSVLEQSTRDRFDSETSPAGIPWAPISKEWKEEKAERGFNTGIMKMRGDLLRSTRFENDDNSVSVIQSQPYAAIHHYGGEIRPKKGRALVVRGRLLGKVTIPARPSIGVSTEDRSEILDAVADFIGRIGRR
jgi:phage virion morphogenesis protein